MNNETHTKTQTEGQLRYLLLKSKIFSGWGSSEWTLSLLKKVFFSAQIPISASVA